MSENYAKKIFESKMLQNDIEQLQKSLELTQDLQSKFMEVIISSLIFLGKNFKKY